MAHQEQINYCSSVKGVLTEYFENKKVLDCGSLDINGNNRYLFTNCEYLGIDIGEGRNVDIVTQIHEFTYPDSYFDTIISTECFEHDIHYKESLENICRLLRSRGLLIFTCATTGRNEHGTPRTSPQDSPFTSKIDTWSDYYKNLEEKDIREAIDIDNIFAIYGFTINPNSHDLYFWGIKK